MSTVADAVGAGKWFWRAYLSVERDAANSNQPLNARDRIGTGPGTTRPARSSRTASANCTPARVTRRCSSTSAEWINGQWTGSPSPVQHDILTGSNADGTVMDGFTCADWTSASAAAVGQVGHSDGMGPGRALPARWRHGIPLTPIRTAPTRHRAAAPGAFTVSPGRSLMGVGD